MRTMKKILWLSLFCLFVHPLHAEVMLLKGYYYLEDVVVKKNVEDLIFFYHQQSLYVIPNDLISMVVGSSPLEGTSLAIDQLETYIKEYQPDFQTHPDVSVLLDHEIPEEAGKSPDASMNIGSWLNKANVTITNTDAEIDRMETEKKKANECLITGSLGAGAYEMEKLNESIMHHNDYFQNVNLPLQNLIKYGITHDLKISLRHKKIAHLGFEVENLSVTSKGGNAVHGEELNIQAREVELYFKLMGAIDQNVFVGMGIAMGKIYVAGEHIRNNGHDDRRVTGLSDESFSYRLFASVDYDVARHAGITVIAGYRGADVSTKVDINETDFSGMYIKSGFYIIIK